MNRINLLPRKIDRVYQIPFNGAASLSVSVGDDVTFDQHLFDVKRNEFAESHYLPKLLGIRPEDSADHVGRIAGEYIEEGDLLAEKLTAGGLIERKIISSTSGIISLDRITQGYIDILGESITVPYDSIVKGKITGISLDSHIEIEASSAKLTYIGDNNMIAAEESETSSVVGGLQLVKNGRSVYTVDDLKESYQGSIVYAGKFVYPTLVKEIFMRGAYAVIAYSMNYSDMIELNVPIVVIGGYGQLSVNRDIEELITGSVNHLVELDTHTKSIYIANKEGVDIKRFPGKRYFSGDLSVGDKVISISPEYKGIVCEVVDIIEQEGANKVIVMVNGKGRIVMYDEMLEHYYFNG